MDSLHKKVAKAVEEDAQNQEDPYLTFFRIRELASSIQENRPNQKIQVTSPSNRKRPPRLTEAWFCCAEPMENQLRSIQDPNV